MKTSELDFHGAGLKIAVNTWHKTVHIIYLGRA
jgi:hypothetical protein